MEETLGSPASHRLTKGQTKRRVLTAASLLMVMAILLGGVALILGREFSQIAELRRSVNRSYEACIQIERVLSVHQDIEIGQRGYWLSGDRAFLEPYDIAVSELGAEFAALRATVGDAPEMQQKIARIEELSQRKLALDQGAIDQDGTPPSVPEIRQGKETMDQLRVAVADLKASEQAVLKEREAAALASRAETQQTVFALLGVLALLLCASTYAIVRAARLRHEALTRLEDVSLRNRAILDSAADAIITLNPSGSIESLNKAATRLYGYSEDELLRRDVGKLFASYPEDGAIPRFLRQLTDAGFVREIVGQRRDGSIFPTDVAVNPMHLTDGIRYVAVIRDITERKRVEQMKAEFVATVSHELRTPLTSIAGSLGLLAGGAAGELPDRAARLIGIAHTNSERLVRLINDILDIEKIESGNMLFQNVPVSLPVLLAQVEEANRGYADRFGASLEITAEGAETAVARVDPDRLTQVLTNLLSNAIKFSGENGQVSLELTPGEKWHRITVRDNGPGIDEAFQSRVFEKFAQEDSSNTRQKGGTGLGLAIAREIVTRLGGRISFESSAHVGTAFHVDLPAVHVASDSKPYVLLVSATPADFGQTSVSLEEAGYACRVAGTAAKALVMAAQQRPAAILIGLALPGEEGIDLIRALRRDPDLAATPILIVAGENGEVNEALSVVDWLTKPVSTERLTETLQEAITAVPSPSSRVLHVDDDPDLLDVVSAALDGRAEVTSVTSLEKAREVLAGNRFDLVILDLGLADGTGTELLPYLRHTDGSLVPVIIFSAQDAGPALVGEVDAVLTKSRTSLGRLVQTVDELILRGQNKEGLIGA